MQPLHRRRTALAFAMLCLGLGGAAALRTPLSCTANDAELAARNSVAHPVVPRSEPDGIDLPSVNVLPGRISEENKQPAEAEKQAVAAVCFLRVFDGSPIANADWLFRDAGISDKPTCKTVRTDSKGFVNIEEGDWIIQSTQPDLVVPAHPIILRVGRTETVWVLRRGALTFLLLTPSGTPIADANGSWIPGTSRDQDWAPTQADAAASRAVIFSAHSGNDGLISFADCPIDSGIAVFVRPGFARRLYHIAGAQPSPIELTMQPSALPSQVVTFESCVDGSPVRGVNIRSNEGYTISTDNGTPGRASIPGWVSPDEPLIVESPRTFRSAFQLSGGAEGTILLHEVSLLKLRVVSSATDTRVVSLGLSARCPRGDPQCATAIFKPLQSIRTGEVVEIACPRGAIIDLHAYAEDGTTADRNLSADFPEQQVEMTLCRSEHILRLAVTNTDNEPITSAWALASHELETSARVRADGYGVLEIPVTDETSSIEVGADGYTSSRICRGPGPGDSGVGRVVLAREHAFRLGLIYSDGTPASGIALRLWPRLLASGAKDFVGPAVWVQSPRQSVARVSDGEGMVRFGGIGIGACKCDFSMASVYQSDGFGNTLHFPSQELVVSPLQDEYVITLDLPLQIGLRVREKSTGLPVSAFQMKGCDEAVDTEVEGDTWRGWIPSGCENLDITVRGIGRGSARVSEITANSTMDVEISPDVLGTVIVTGSRDQRLDGIAVFRVFRNASSGLQSLGTVRVPMEGGRCSFCLPFVGDLELSCVEIAGAPMKDKCTPATASWVPDGVVEFRLDEDH